MLHQSNRHSRPLAESRRGASPSLTPVLVSPYFYFYVLILIYDSGGVTQDCVDAQMHNVALFPLAEGPLVHDRTLVGSSFAGSVRFEDVLGYDQGVAGFSGSCTATDEVALELGRCKYC